MREYYYLVGEDRVGPLTLDELKSLVGLSADRLVSYAGLESWVRADELEELSELFVRKYYYSVGEDHVGPMSLSELRLVEGLTSETMVWHADLSDWVRAAELPELSSALERLRLEAIEVAIACGEIDRPSGSHEESLSLDELRSLKRERAESERKRAEEKRQREEAERKREEAERAEAKRKREELERQRTEEKRKREEAERAEAARKHEEAERKREEAERAKAKHKRQEEERKRELEDGIAEGYIPSWHERNLSIEKIRKLEIESAIKKGYISHRERNLPIEEIRERKREFLLSEAIAKGYISRRERDLTIKEIRERAESVRQRLLKEEIAEGGNLSRLQFLSLDTLLDRKRKRRKARWGPTVGITILIVIGIGILAGIYYLLKYLYNFLIG